MYKKSEYNFGFYTSILLPVVGAFLLAGSVTATAYTKGDLQVNSNADILFDNLINEHLSLLIGALRSSYDNRSDLESILTALDNNSVAIADTIEAIYGSAGGEMFLDIWRGHITYLVNYSDALEKNDSVGKEMAMEDIDLFDSRFANFLMQVKPDTPYTDIDETVSGYVLTLKSTIDTYSEEDYEKFYINQREASRYIISLSDLLTPR